MRLHHPEASAQHFEMSVPKSGDNDEGAEEETEEEEEEEGGGRGGGGGLERCKTVHILHTKP